MGPVAYSAIVLFVSINLTFLLTETVCADFYQWIEKQGIVGFTDDLQKVPPAYRKSVKRITEITGPSLSNSSTSNFQVTQKFPIPEQTIQTEQTRDSYETWRERVSKAREELEELKTQHQQAEEYRITLLRQVWYQWGFADDTVFANMLA